MARFLVRTADKDPGEVVDPEVYARDYNHKGDIIAVQPNGWVYGTAESLPNFVVINVSGIRHKRTRKYREAWRRRFDCSHARIAAESDTVRVNLDTTTPVGVDGRGGFKPAEFDGTLASWGMSPVYIPSKVSADVGVFTILQSQGFWGNLPVDEFTFSEVYADPTHTLSITYPKAVHPNLISNAATVKGGDVLSNKGGTLVVEFTADDVVNELSQLLRGTDDRVCKCRFHINSAVVDQAIAAGGTLSLSRAEFTAALMDRSA